VAIPIICHGYRCVTKYFLDPLRCPTQMCDKQRSGGVPQAVKAIARPSFGIDKAAYYLQWVLYPTLNIWQPLNVS
jgi:hypothetical protein